MNKDPCGSGSTTRKLTQVRCKRLRLLLPGGHLGPAAGAHPQVQGHLGRHSSGQLIHLSEKDICPYFMISIEKRRPVTDRKYVYI